MQLTPHPVIGMAWYEQALRQPVSVGEMRSVDVYMYIVRPRA